MSENIINNTRVLPVLALRGVVVFPRMIVHFDVGREKSVKALDDAMNTNQTVLLITQRDMSVEEPVYKDLYSVGVLAKIRQMVKLPSGGVRVLAEGISRCKCLSFVKTDPAYYAECIVCEEETPKCSETYKDALLRRTRALFEEYAQLVPKMPPDIAATLLSTTDIGYLADFIANNISVDIDDKQFILEQFNQVKRLKTVLTMLQREKEIIKIDAKINQNVQESMDERQRSYYLQEQLKAISEELYGGDDPQEEADGYFERIAAMNMPQDIKDKLFKEVEKLLKMPGGSHEATVVRNYLDTCLELPWGIYTESKIDLEKSQKILDRDHYGLEKIKKRMIEMLAVHSLAPNIKGQIICFVGPPGVGKTSIAKSVAECMGRKYARVSLGGVSDEAEIRGHRKTYIGAMPGRLINAIKTAGSANPLILLDEVDKLDSNYKGDPSAALLEVLDSEQNSTFVDHYIDLPFDLSKVLFITTANSADTIPGPLLDRMEIIEISSYTREDKFHIAKNHLIKKQLKEHGLNGRQLKIADEVIYKLVDNYTHEAGVRNLSREIASLCRKAATRIVSGEAKSVIITATNLKDFLGVEKYKPDAISANDEVGLVNGLAWTSVGGVLMQMEVAAVKGTGKLVLTGSLGDVMQESAKTAVTYVRSKADEYHIDSNFYKDLDIHIHATEGAVPKDGPSAGVAMVTALVSCLTNTPIKRDVAMTGEVTLRGRVLPIGGLKEKSMAAYKSGIKTVFIPVDNVPNLEEVDEQVKKNVTFIPAQNVSEIILGALVMKNEMPSPESKNKKIIVPSMDVAATAISR